MLDRRTMRAALAGCALVALLRWGDPALATPSPSIRLPRIVSINPCLDAILVRVAEPQQIAGISHYSQDPIATSIPLQVARRFHATSGTAEEVIALAPDEVISGPHVSPSTLDALERLGVHLTKLGVPESVAESERQIRVIAAIASAPERGEILIEQIESALARAGPPDDRLLPALIWQSNGVVPGKGTLADELLRRTGYRNLSASYGLHKWDILPLEYLIAAPPALVLSPGTGRAGRDRTLEHPVLRRLAGSVAFRSYPFRLLQCGGPTIVESVSRLAAIRHEPWPP